MDIIGYVTLYIRTDFEDHSEYIKHSSDFTNPLTEEALKEVLDIMEEALNRLDRYPSSLCYVTEEEYETGTKGISQIAYEWK